MSATVDGAKTLASGTLSGAFSGAIMPSLLTARAGQWVGLQFGRAVSVVVGSSGYLLASGANLFRSKEDRLNTLSGFHIVPLAPFGYIAAGLSLTTASSVLVVVTPLSTIGGTLFGAVYTLSKSGKRKLHGVVACSEKTVDQRLDSQKNSYQKTSPHEADLLPQQMERSMRMDNASDDDFPLMIDRFVQISGVDGKPLVLTEESTVEMLSILQQGQQQLGLDTSDFIERLFALIERCPLRNGDDLCEALLSGVNFMTLCKYREELDRPEWGADLFDQLLDDGFLSDPVNYQPTASSVDELTEEQILQYRTLDAYLEADRKAYITRQLARAESAQVDLLYSRFTRNVC